jgi:UDP-N-acetylglucosamine acyltransferase
VSDRVVIANNAQLAGHVRVARKAIIGGMCGVHHFASIGELTMVGSMCGVRVDLPPFVIAEGTPAEPRTINVIGLRRDGFSEEDIDLLRKAFIVLYHKRGARTVREVVDEVLVTAPTDPAHPVQRVCNWLIAHLEHNIKGRVQEAFREPVIGGKPVAKA